jgi:hypothetical protein
LVGTLGTAPGLLGNRTFFWRAKTDAGTTRFRKTYRDRLFGGSSAMFAFPNVMYLFTNKFAGLGARRLPLPFGFSSSLHGLFLWHV